MMPVRGLAGRAGAVLGATATCSVAACICRILRRQNTIDSSCSRRLSALPRTRYAPFEPECTQPGTAARLPPKERILTKKMSTKAKARTIVRAFSVKLQCEIGLFVFFRLLFRGRQAF